MKKLKIAIFVTVISSAVSFSASELGVVDKGLPDSFEIEASAAVDPDDYACSEIVETPSETYVDSNHANFDPTIVPGVTLVDAEAGIYRYEPEVRLYDAKPIRDTAYRQTHQDRVSLGLIIPAGESIEIRLIEEGYSEDQKISLLTGDTSVEIYRANITSTDWQTFTAVKDSLLYSETPGYDPNGIQLGFEFKFSYAQMAPTYYEGSNVDWQSWVDSFRDSGARWTSLEGETISFMVGCDEITQLRSVSLSEEELGVEPLFDYYTSIDTFYTQLLGANDQQDDPLHFGGERRTMVRRNYNASGFLYYYYGYIASAGKNSVVSNYMVNTYNKWGPPHELGHGYDVAHIGEFGEAWANIYTHNWRVAEGRGEGSIFNNNREEVEENFFSLNQDSTLDITQIVVLFSKPMEALGQDVFAQYNILYREHLNSDDQELVNNFKRLNGVNGYAYTLIEQGYDINMFFDQFYHMTDFVKGKAFTTDAVTYYPLAKYITDETKIESLMTENEYVSKYQLIDSNVANSLGEREITININIDNIDNLIGTTIELSDGINQYQVAITDSGQSITLPYGVYRVNTPMSHSGMYTIDSKSDYIIVNETGNPEFTINYKSVNDGIDIKEYNKFDILASSGYTYVETRINEDGSNIYFKYAGRTASSAYGDNIYAKVVLFDDHNNVVYRDVIHGNDTNNEYLEFEFGPGYRLELYVAETGKLLVSDPFWIGDVPYLSTKTNDNIYLMTDYGLIDYNWTNETLQQYIIAITERYEEYYLSVEDIDYNKNAYVRFMTLVYLIDDETIRNEYINKYGFDHNYPFTKNDRVIIDVDAGITDIKNQIIVEDIIDGEIDDFTVDDTNVDYSQEGEYPVIITATNSSGHTSNIQVEVIVASQSRLLIDDITNISWENFALGEIVDTVVFDFNEWSDYEVVLNEELITNIDDTWHIESTDELEYVLIEPKYEIDTDESAHFSIKYESTASNGSHLSPNAIVEVLTKPAYERTDEALNYAEELTDELAWYITNNNSQINHVIQQEGETVKTSNILDTNYNTFDLITNSNSHIVDLMSCTLPKGDKKLNCNSHNATNMELTQAETNPKYTTNKYTGIRFAPGLEGSIDVLSVSLDAKVQSYAEIKTDVDSIEVAPGTSLESITASVNPRFYQFIEYEVTDLAESLTIDNIIDDGGYDSKVGGTYVITYGYEDRLEKTGYTTKQISVTVKEPEVIVINDIKNIDWSIIEAGDIMEVSMQAFDSWLDYEVVLNDQLATYDEATDSWTIIRTEEDEYAIIEPLYELDLSKPARFSVKFDSASSYGPIFSKNGFIQFYTRPNYERIDDSINYGNSGTKENAWYLTNYGSNLSQVYKEDGSFKISNSIPIADYNTFDLFIDNANATSKMASCALPNNDKDSECSADKATDLYVIEPAINGQFATNNYVGIRFAPGFDSYIDISSISLDATVKSYAEITVAQENLTVDVGTPIDEVLLQVNPQYNEFINYQATVVNEPLDQSAIVDLNNYDSQTPGTYQLTLAVDNGMENPTLTTKEIEITVS